MLLKPINLYIDPGTGSMLFAVLIGVIGAAAYMVRGWLVKLKFLLTGGNKSSNEADVIPIAIFSDDKRYWSVFKPLCEELNKRGVDVKYLTASEDDPILDNNLEHISGEFIGSGNRAFSRLNYLKATLLISTTPGLDVYQWKRSPDVRYYVHIMHSPSDITRYRMFGIDYYDAILLSGDYQATDVRNLEKLRNLPKKELSIVGIPYMDAMVDRLMSDDSVERNDRNDDVTVLLAPSWGPSSIFNKYGSSFIDRLIDTGYNIIIRPHPQSFASEAEMIADLMKKYPNSDKIEWNRDNDNFDVLRRSDIMISDFSGVQFEFALVYDKPVIYADTEFDKAPYDAWWLDTPFWTMSALPRIGKELTKDNLDIIKELIDDCLNNPVYAEGRKEVVAETWAHKGEGSKLMADYVVSKYEELVNEKEMK